MKHYTLKQIEEFAKAHNLGIEIHEETEYEFAYVFVAASEYADETWTWDFENGLDCPATDFEYYEECD